MSPPHVFDPAKTPSAHEGVWDRLKDLLAHVTEDDKLHVRRERKTVVFLLEAQRVGDAIATVRLRSTETHPKRVDPPNSFDAGLDVEWSRDAHPDGELVINLVSAKPTHNIATGNYAIGLALALARWARSPTAQLYDASSKWCSKDERLWLRPARILARGSGWYESKQFKSIVETLDAEEFHRHVESLQHIPRKALLSVARRWDRVLRQAVVDNAIDKGRVYAVVVQCDGTRAERPITLVEGIRLLERVSHVCDVLGVNARCKDKATLGECVEALVDADCSAARRLTSALLPSGRDDDDVTLVLLSGDRPLPRQVSWVYTWAALQTRGVLRIRLDGGA